MGISRSDLITAIINAQDNFDDEYYKLFELYKNAFNSDIKNHEFTKEFMVEDLDLIQYINAVITA